jgi:hypothetical protein
VTEGEAHLVSFAVTGHPLGGTWGAISSPVWGGPASNNPVASMTPIYDGFLVVPAGTTSGSFTAVYMQSPLPPSRDGTLTYIGRHYCFSSPRCFDENGNYVWKYASDLHDGAFVPIPEPGSIVLVGLGLASLAAKRRARRHRRVARPR